MSIKITTVRLSAVALAAAALALSSVSFAQQPPAAGGAPGGGGGGQGRRGGGFGRGMQATLSSIPAAVLADGLKLNSTQTSKIAAIQDQYQKDRRSLFSSVQPGGDRQEAMQKMQTLTEETNKSIEGVLTDSQNKAAPGFVKAVGGYRMVGIPLEVLPELKLTSDQRNKITVISEATQKQMADARAAQQSAGGNGGGPGGFQAFQEIMKTNSDKAQAVLTATQKATLAKYNADHPMRGPGGGGGGRRGGGGGAAGGGNGPV